MKNIHSCAIIIAGASGDLARRKLIPALDSLYKQGKICNDIAVIGTGRSDFTNEQFRSNFAISDDFANHLHYYKNTAGIKQFIESLGQFSKIIVFLSLPPSAYAASAKEFADERFEQKVSIVIEKPFGYDYASAKLLNSQLAGYYDESQIFRIDHYLAKEAVQNIMVFRYGNTVFNPVWNSHYVESIQINAIEKLTIVERAGYFDKSGIIRDMVQNHLLQLLALLTMEAPVTLDPHDVKIQKVSLLKSIKIEEIHRYQYDTYREENGVDPESTTETFAELRLSINNMRWAGVPVYIRTGKAVHRKGTEIGVRFKAPPKVLFNENGDIPANQIIFKIQPAEGIVLDIATKTPGADEQISPTYMNFCYNQNFTGENPEAYQKLLFDALRGDHTLFVSAEETETAWKLFEEKLDRGDVAHYTTGKLPQSKFDIRWIDFDYYVNFCA